jgi:hypothetical protein
LSKRYGPVEQRFDDNITHEPNSGCWLWVGLTDEFGYGIFKIGRARVRAHRYSFGRFRAAIPSGLCVLHRCDVPGCVNPDHLFLGTLAENVADKVAKDRQAKGAQNPSAKLTTEDVVAIRASTETHRALAAQYGVAHRTIGQIKKRQKWRHVA